MLHLTAFVAGLLFAVGLGVSGMTQHAKVFRFLDVTGDWDPSLALVMVGAIAVHAATLRLILGRERPLFASRFALPTRTDLEPRLVAGAAVFGVGWGIAGYCPGPAVTAPGSALAGMMAAAPSSASASRRRARVSSSSCSRLWTRSSTVAVLSRFSVRTPAAKVSSDAASRSSAACISLCSPMRSTTGVRSSLVLSRGSESTRDRLSKPGCSGSCS